MTSVRDDDGPVVEDFRAGDEAALADLYDRWSPLVYSLALRSLGDVARAEEVTQRTFTGAWESRASFDPAETRFSDWLVDLARRHIADFAAPESKTGVLAERMMVADTLSHLGSRSQRVLRLALDDHLTPAQIAERTGLGVDEVRSEIASSLMELRQRLKEEQADAH